MHVFPAPVDDGRATITAPRSHCRHWAKPSSEPLGNNGKKRFSWSSKLFRLFFMPSDVVVNRVDRTLAKVLAVLSLFMFLGGSLIMIIALFTYWSGENMPAAGFIVVFTAFLLLCFTTYILSRSRHILTAKLLLCFLISFWVFSTYAGLGFERSQGLDVDENVAPPAALMMWLPLIAVVMTRNTRKERIAFHIVDACIVLFTFVLVGSYAQTGQHWQNECFGPLLLYFHVRVTTSLRAAAESEMAKDHSKKEAAESRSALFCSLNHDIRTHLNGVMGCLDVIRSNMHTGMDQQQIDDINGDDCDLYTEAGGTGADTQIRSAARLGTGSNSGKQGEAGSGKEGEVGSGSSAWPELAWSLIPTCWTSCESLLGLVNDILDFQKMQTQQFTVESTPMNLRRTISHIHRMMMPLAKRKGLALSVEVDQALPASIMSDQRRFEQVLLNLISNAIKFTYQGQVRLVCRRKSTDNKDGDSMIVEIIDSGPGISPDNAKTLFKPFAQLENGKRYGRSGAGLGLCICKDIVEAFGGTIGVVDGATETSSVKATHALPSDNTSSTEGMGETGHVGSTFRVVLPLRVAAGSASSSVPQTPTTVGASQRNDALRTPDTVRVLVAEDSPVNVKVMLHMFKSLPYVDAHMVENGKLAVDAVQASLADEGRPYDLVLCDVNMPVMNGFEACALIKPQVGHVNGVLPVVACTASDPNEIKQRADTAGFDGIITKPITRQVLVDTLAKYVPGLDGRAE